MNPPLERWIALAVATLLLSCSSSQGTTSACPLVDFSVSGFSPPSAKSGQSVKPQFTGTATTPAACLLEFHIKCGAQDTRYFLGLQDGQPAASLVLHCDGATSNVACSYSFAYPRDNPTSSGNGAGPTCEP